MLKWICNISRAYEEHKRNLKDLNKEELLDLKRILSMCDGIIKPGSYYFFPFQKEIYKYTLIIINSKKRIQKIYIPIKRLLKR